MPNNFNIQRRNRLVERHLDYAQRLARSFSQQTGLDHDDLFQVAVLGLLKATKAYRSEMNVPFEAFARPHARGAILHYMRDSVAMVRLPRRLEEEAQRLRHSNRPRNSHEQWMEATHRSKTRWQPLPLDVQAGADTGISMMLNAERRTIVRRALDELQPSERQAVQYVVLDGRSLRNVGTSLGVSAMTIQRRVKSGLKQLESKLCSLNGAN